ncbi:MAG: hypothetical protein ABL901_14755 [Hyphomicrobiaceae bacterium]
MRDAKSYRAPLQEERSHFVEIVHWQAVFEGDGIPAHRRTMFP